MKFGVSVFCQNYEDWPRYLSGDFSNPAKNPDHEMVMEDLRLADMVEHLGYDAIWATEHHFTPYELMPDAIQFLNYFAGRTQRVGMATMVIVLPWHDPVRVAENLSFLDVMLKGRPITVGFGRGAARVEFETFNIPMEESRGRFIEAHDIVRLALTQELFSYDGEFFQVPETTIRPQPLSKDLPSRMYCAANSTASVEMAAEAGLGMMIIPQKSWEAYADDIKIFNARRAAVGLSPRNPVTGCFMYCGANDEEVRIAQEQYYPNMIYTSTRHYEHDEPDHFRNTKGYEHYVETAEKLRDGRALRSEQDDTQVIGTPEQCLDKLRRIQTMTKPSEMFGMVKFGGMPPEVAQKSLELFAKEVLPELHKDPILDPAG